MTNLFRPSQYKDFMQPSVDEYREMHQQTIATQLMLSIVERNFESVRYLAVLLAAIAGAMFVSFSGMEPGEAGRGALKWIFFIYGLLFMLSMISYAILYSSMGLGMLAGQTDNSKMRLQSQQLGLMSGFITFVVLVITVSVSMVLLFVIPFTV